jgi:hypothetical protein
MADFKILNKKIYDEIISKLQNGESIDDLFKNANPATISHGLEEAQAEFTKGKHPFDLYEKPELFKDVNIRTQPNMKDHGALKYFENPKTGLYEPDTKLSLLLKDKNDMATLGHEAQHGYDQVSQLKVPQPIELEGKSLLSKIKNEVELGRAVSSPSELKGLKEATAYYADHFKPDVEGNFNKLKQMLNLERVVKGNPLKAIIPVMKAAGIGALGMAAAGIGNKAMAGDYKGAAEDSVDLGTDIAPVIGEAKLAYQTGKKALGIENLENSDTPEDMIQDLPQDIQDKYNKTRFMKLQDKLNKGI